MRKSQKIITTVLWSFLVLTMVAVVGRGMWTARENAPANGVEVISDAPKGDHGLPVYFDAPHFKLTDEDGKPFDSDQLKGQVWIAAFIFTNCPGACPMMTQKMAKLQEAVPAANVKLVSFSVDPERDTPAVLKAYAGRFKADSSRWHFLTGDKQAMLDAARGLKLSVTPAEGSRPIDHDERFLLVDTQGRVRGVYHSSNEDELKELAHDATALAGS
jgi:cytochrome oxidase Cu insertion factor (SCO1/SenC/PrrC family)